MTYDYSRDAIAPHGGVLVDRFADQATREDLVRRVDAADLPEIRLDVRQLSDLELIANGALSPLDGFMGRGDYERVVAEGRLASGVPWTIPITLAVRADVADDLGPGEPTVALRAPDGQLAGAMTVTERWTFDKEREASQVYGTTDRGHPGVSYLMTEAGERLIGGPILMLGPTAPAFPRHHADPRALRKLFRDRGWRRIVAFQTRNPIHRAHEFITKTALEMCDGLLVHPLVGVTKEDDIPAATRMACYEALLGSYYPTARVVLSTLPAAMRYAGPKEAVLHAILRKNYGCTHFIVGRDHAGFANTYGTYDAQKIFDRYSPEEIDITPLRFEHSFYCRRCAAMATGKTCPHDVAHHLALSGTRVRELLRAGERPPPELTRPEVADILASLP